MIIAKSGMFRFARRATSVRSPGRPPLRYPPTTGSTAATVIGFLYAFGGIACLLGARFPMSPHLAVGLSRLLGILDLFVASSLFILRRRLSAVTLNVVLAAGTVLASILVASTGSAVGVVLPGVVLSLIHI